MNFISGPKTLLPILCCFFLGCASLPHAKNHPDWSRLNLNKQASIDLHVLKSDLYAMRSEWLKSQIELEDALELQKSEALILRRALVMAQRGQYELAQEEIQKLITQGDHTNIEAYLALGEVQALQNKAQAAITTYKRVLSLDAKNHKALIFLGAIYSQLGKFSSSRYYFSKLKAIPEHRHLAYYYLGRLNQQLKHYKKSAKEFKTCIRVDKGFADCHFSLADTYILLNDKSKAISVLENFKKTSSDAERVFAKLYDLYTETAQVEKAFDQLVVLERFEPQNTYIKLQMAMYFLKKDSIKLAESKLLEVLKISPKFDRAHFLLTSMFVREKNLKKATRYYEKLKPKSPYFIDASLLLAKLKEEQNSAKDSYKFLQKANREADASRISIYIAILQNRIGQPLKSIQTLQELVKKDKENLQALYYLGHLQGENGDLEDALKNMRKVLGIDPNHVDALNYTAYYLADSGKDLKQALSFAQKANKLRPGDGHILDTLGWVHFQMRKFDQAQIFLEKAYVLHPDESVIAEHLAQVYSRKGFADKALQVYNQILKQGLGDRERIIRQIKSIKQPSRSTSSSRAKSSAD